MDPIENNQPSQEQEAVQRVTKDPLKVKAGKKGALVKKIRNANSKRQSAHSTSECAHSTTEVANSKCQCAHSTTERANSISHSADSTGGSSKSQYAKSILLLGMGVGVGIICGRFVFFKKNTEDFQLKKQTNSHYMR